MTFESEMSRYIQAKSRIMRHENIISQSSGSREMQEALNNWANEYEAETMAEYKRLKAIVSRIKEYDRIKSLAHSLKCDYPIFSGMYMRDAQEALQEAIKLARGVK